MNADRIAELKRWVLNASMFSEGSSYNGARRDDLLALLDTVQETGAAGISTGTGKAGGKPCEKAAPPQPTDYKLRPEVGAFAALMEMELREHDDRPGWKNELSVWLMDRLREEVEELERSLIDEEHGVQVAKEAADVANFAMMIADVEGGLVFAPPQHTDTEKYCITFRNYQDYKTAVLKLCAPSQPKKSAKDGQEPVSRI